MTLSGEDLIWIGVWVVVCLFCFWVIGMNAVNIIFHIRMRNKAQELLTHSQEQLKQVQSQVEAKNKLLNDTLQKMRDDYKAYIQSQEKPKRKKAAPKKPKKSDSTS